jgi:hypothetical protein
MYWRSVKHTLKCWKVFLGREIAAWLRSVGLMPPVPYTDNCRTLKRQAVFSNEMRVGT